MTMPSDAAEGTAAIAVVVLGDMGSPPHRAAERPIAKVGFCRKPAFYLPVAGSRAPEMAL